MALTRSKIDLAKIELVIQEIHSKKTIRDIILEIPGIVSGTKADILTSDLRDVLQDFGIRIVRLIKTVKLWLTNLDDSVIVSAVPKIKNH